MVRQLYRGNPKQAWFVLPRSHRRSGWPLQAQWGGDIGSEGKRSSRWPDNRQSTRKTTTRPGDVFALHGQGPKVQAPRMQEKRSYQAALIPMTSAAPPSSKRNALG